MEGKKTEGKKIVSNWDLNSEWLLSVFCVAPFAFVDSY